MEMSPKKRFILQSAALLFRNKGYTATTLKEIANEVDMEAPSLYNHFHSKEEILSILLIDIAHHFIDGIESIIQANLNPIQQLEKTISLHIELSINAPDVMSIMIADFVHLNPENLSIYLNLRHKYESYFRSIIISCIDQKLIKSEDVELIIFNLLSTLRSLYAWLGKHPNVNKYNLESSLTNMFLDGIRSK